MLDVGFGAALLAGLLSFVSPCVLPIVPPYLAYMSGVTVQVSDGRRFWLPASSVSARQLSCEGVRAAVPVAVRRRPSRPVGDGEGDLPSPGGSEIVRRRRASGRAATSSSGCRPA